MKLAAFFTDLFLWLFALTMSLSLYFGLLVLVVLYIFYKYAFDYGYWKRKGVYFIKPLPIIGNLYDVFLSRCSLAHLLQKLYSEVDLPYFGIYFLNKPLLFAKSPDVIQAILVKDFSYFGDRTLLCEEKCDRTVSKMVSAAKNPFWKQLRLKLTPIFSSMKMKKMCCLLNITGQELNIYIGKNINNIIEMKELCAKYMTDVTTSCMFGINAHSFDSENSQFTQIGRKLFDFSYKTAFSQSCYMMAHSLVRLFKLRFMDKDVGAFLINAISRTLRERESSKLVRHDLIDTIIEMKNGSLLDEETCIAQAIQFFIGGFETTSTVMAFTLYELAINPEVQTKLRQEVQSATSQTGAFTYEAIHDMKYLNMVLSETLRKYPSLPFIDRECVKDYTIPGSDVVIEKGTAIFVSILGLHYDETYFPEPQKFDPERFSDVNSFREFSYMPFGRGPRNCIGERFAVLAGKLGLAHIISKYEWEPCDATPIPIKYEAKSFFLAVVGGLPLKFKRISAPTI